MWKRIVLEYIINEFLSSPNSPIRDKVKAVLDLSNYATKIELEQSTKI